MTPKVLGLASSPRRHGNTERLLDAALEGAAERGAEVEKVAVSTLKIEPCNACYHCTRTGQCLLHDDMDGLYPKLQAADAVILACPVYFGGVTAQAKAMIDRCLLLWTLRRNLKQPWRKKGDRPKGLFIATAGSSSLSMFRGAQIEARGFLSALDARWQPPLFFGGATSRGDLLKIHPTALEQAREVGARLV